MDLDTYNQIFDITITLHIIIHHEDRKSYYSALASWDEKQDIEPMVKFLKEQTIKTWKNQIIRSV